MLDLSVCVYVCLISGTYTRCTCFTNACRVDAITFEAVHQITTHTKLLKAGDKRNVHE